MVEDSSKFFPKGVTALVIYRALPWITDFASLSDYLRTLGKELSTDKKIYRQRRHKVLKYALGKLSDYGLVAKREAPGTYIALANHEAYLKFLKENAKELYERTKFYIAWSTSELVKVVGDRYMAVSWERFGTHALSDKGWRRFGNYVDRSSLYERAVHPFIQNKFEPVSRDKDQIELLNLILASMKMEPEELRLAIQDIVFNNDKQVTWISQEIGGFLGAAAEKIYSKDGMFFDFFEAEHDAIVKVLGKDPWIRRVIPEAQDPRGKIYMETTEPWWMIQFQVRLKEIVNGSVSGQS